MMRPPSGTMVWWRKRGALEWRFGYVTYVNQNLVRMGAYNGDSTGGAVVSISEIEWQRYS